MGDSIYNSELSEEEQIKPLALLLALGILQIEANDQQLIKDLSSEMAKWSDEDKMQLRNSKMGFSFEDLNSVFEAKSAPTTPVDSDGD